MPFSGRQALTGRRQKDDQLLRAANLPALEQALEERFFARSQAIKNAAVRVRLSQLLDKAKRHAEALLAELRSDALEQSQRLLSADALLFARDVLPAERKRLIAEAGTAHQIAAQETLSFVRPRRWAFGEHQAAPADRDFLLTLLDEKLSVLCQASRTRVVEALQLGEADGDLLRVDADSGRLDCLTDLSGRTQAEIDLTLEQEGWGRELFSVMRRAVSSAECGATIFD